MVVPLTILVIFLLLSLTFFIHARSWYTFAAYESMMLANSEGRSSMGKGEQLGKGRMEQYISRIPLPAEPVSFEVECREKQVCVQVQGKILPAFSQKEWEYSVSGKMKRCNPVKTIRKIRAVKQLWKQNEE